MGVEYVEELFTGRAGEDGYDRKRSYTRNFEVRTTSPSDDPTVAGGTSLLPRNGEPYPLDQYSLLTKIRPVQNDADPTLWTVSCEYSNELPGGVNGAHAKETGTIDPATGDSKESPSGKSPSGDNQARPDNPLDREATYKITHEQSEEPMVYCLKTGEPILNCADLPYDPPPMREMSYAVVTVTKNFAVVKFDWLENFMNAVNVAKWNNRSVRTARILALDYERHSENNVNFWQVTFRIKIKPQTWDRFLPEVGYYEKVPDGTWSDGLTQKYKLVEIDEPKGTGAKPDKPHRLDGYRRTQTGSFTAPVNGIVSLDNVIVSNDAGAGDPPVPTSPTFPFLTSGLGKRLDSPNTTLVYTRWRDYPEKAFSLLGL